MRYTFVKTLLEEAQKNKNIVLLTGDLGFTVFEPFKEAFPDRFFNIGVAEQNMMSVAAGLAMTGKIVFAYSIATFATMRTYEQIRDDIASHNASVVVVGTGAGLSYGDASITHHAIEDIGLMRGIPGVTVLCPSDPVEVAWATRECIAIKRPTYLRLGKKGEPVLHTNNPQFKIGKGVVIKDGKDVAIFATGNIVSHVLSATEILAKKNINAAVISMHSIKPLDRNLIEKLANTCSLVVTVEEHNIIGGLGSAVSEVLSEQKNKSARQIRIGIADTFVFDIGSQEFLREKVGLTPEKIATRISLEL